MQMLRIGSRGPDVIRYQKELNDRMLRPNNQLTRPPMIKLVEDGNFGPKTQAMVIEFQKLNQIKPDGLIGSDTAYLLLPYIAFAVKLSGEGRIRGRRRTPGLEQPGVSSPAIKSQFKRPLLGGVVRASELTLGNEEEKKGSRLSFRSVKDSNTPANPGLSLNLTKNLKGQSQKQRWLLRAPFSA